VQGDTVALRSDDMIVTAQGDGRLDGRIIGIEYQGTHVALTAELAGGQEVTARMPDAVFLQTPKDLGDVIGLNWEDRVAHPVAP
jgi:putative spermidine/putrescine transport system ATP-binding protein